MINILAWHYFAARLCQKIKGTIFFFFFWKISRRLNYICYANCHACQKNWNSRFRLNKTNLSCLKLQTFSEFLSQKICKDPWERDFNQRSKKIGSTNTSGRRTSDSMIRRESGYFGMRLKLRILIPENHFSRRTKYWFSFFFFKNIILPPISIFFNPMPT